MQLSDLRDVLLGIEAPVFHYEAYQQTGNYIVWAEDEGQADMTTTKQLKSWRAQLIISPRQNLTYRRNYSRKT